MAKLYYPAIFHPEEVGYSVTVPDIDGCFSEGDNLEEAIKMAASAISLCLEECNGNFPVASDPTTIPHSCNEFIYWIPFEPAKGKKQK